MKNYQIRNNKNIFDFLIRFLIFDFLFLMLAFAPQGANAQEASFYLLPSEGSYPVGEGFSVNLFVSTEGIAMNAAEATIYFPSNKLKVLNISKQNSIFTLWVQEPTFSNSQGIISFCGGLPSPGYIGRAGKIMTINFQGKTAGQAKVFFEEEKILANDPWGTNIFSSSREANYLITVPEFLPPKEIPPKIPAKIPIVDEKPPQSFEIIVDNEGDATNPSPLLYFQTKDDLSGMSHYEVEIQETIFRVEVDQTLPWRISTKLVPGNYLILVRAFDKAGNFREERTEVKIESISIPQITVYPKTLNPDEELLYLSGTALPDSKVIIFFEKDSELIKKWEITADQVGDWFLAKEILVKSGIYKISAKTEDKRGVQSDSSESYFVRVTLGAITIGHLIIRYKNITLLAIILLILLLAGTFYLFWRIRKTKKAIERETKDLKAKFYKEYKELQLDIEKELEVLKRVRGEKKITPKEKMREEELLKNLADVREVLEKELKDIEEIK